MMRPSLVMASLALALLAPALADAEECKVRIEHAGNVLQGNRVYSHWLIGHTPRRWATVSFRYRLTVLDDADKKSEVDGRFRQLISGREEEYIELKSLRSRAALVTRTEVSDITCEP
ncbi:MAG: hypothetical protein HC871_11915 [Rhizobiales bacterium]|nr:hypothetical protein [Hyphomicrobiales bacterium]